MTKPTWNKLFNVFGSRVKDLFEDKLSSQKLMVTSWRMILFVSALAVFVIYSSHKVDQKVIRISKLNEKLKDLRSRHIDMRTQLMSVSKTTKVAEEVEKYGLFESLDAPYKIQVQN